MKNKKYEPLKLIGSGAQSSIYICQDKAFVKKIFLNGSAEEKLKQASYEFKQLKRLTHKIKNMKISGISCPKPIAVVEGSEPGIIMENCSGIELHKYFLNNNVSRLELVSIAFRLCHAVISYVDEFDEPYWDFCGQNILYDEIKDELTILDFNEPDFKYDKSLSCQNLTVSLGNFVGWELYQLSRPKNFFSRFFKSKTYRELSELLIVQVKNQGEITIGDLQDVISFTYTRLSNKGNIKRKFWYKSMGYLVYVINCFALFKIKHHDK